MKPVHVMSSTNIDFGVENTHENFNFKVGDHVRVSKCKYSFAKGYVQSW